MKIRSQNFINQYLSKEDKEKIILLVGDNGKDAFQPFNWTQENKKVPKVLKKTDGANETIWILIRYLNTYDTLSITDDYEHETNNEYQRAIEINITDDSVYWVLYKNIKKVHKKFMRTYSLVKNNA